MKGFRGIEWSTYVRARNQERKDGESPNLYANRDIPTEVDEVIEEEHLQVDIEDYKALNSEVPVKIKLENKTPDAVEVFCYDVDGKKVSQGKVEASAEASFETFVTHNWCCEGPGFYSLNGE